MLTKFSIKLHALLAGFLGLFFVGCQDQLEVRTFDLERLHPMEAQGLIAPYVYEDRAGAPGMVSAGSVGVLTVRELPENLRRIADVLERYDRPAVDVQLRFQLIEANGFEGTDRVIAHVQDELENLLRYEGYRFAGEAVLQIREGQDGQTKIDRLNPTEQEPPFDLSVRVNRTTGSGEDLMAEIAIRLDHSWYQELLDTEVSVRNGQSMVLGTTTAGRGDAEALILVVTPTVR